MSTKDRDNAWVDYAHEPWDTTRYASERHEGFNAGWAAAMETLREAKAEAWDEAGFAMDRVMRAFGKTAPPLINPYKEENR